MQACLENAARPLLESASLPLVDTAPPAWTIRVARPATADRKELAKELHGVPKAALRQVFGKALGTRLWQHNRAAPSATNAKANPVAAISPGAPMSDAEISGGMLRYLCAEAAATLCQHKRFAKSIGLTVQYPSGESETVRQPLPLATNEAPVLEAAACLALRSMRSNAFISLKLDVSVTIAPSAPANAAVPAEANAHLTCVA